MSILLESPLFRKVSNPWRIVVLVFNSRSCWNTYMHLCMWFLCDNSQPTAHRGTFSNIRILFVSGILSLVQCLNLHSGVKRVKKNGVGGHFGFLPLLDTYIQLATKCGSFSLSHTGWPNYTRKQLVLSLHSHCPRAPPAFCWVTETTSTWHPRFGFLPPLIHPGPHC